MTSGRGGRSCTRCPAVHGLDAGSRQRCRSHGNRCVRAESPRAMRPAAIGRWRCTFCTPR
eukprot:6662568-Prymnesium_polylepis.2